MYPFEAGALKTGTSIPAAGRKKVWIDLDNSPHVPFFRPIIAELEGRGHELLVTARDAYQVRELVRFYGLSCKIVGKHHGKHKVMKALGTFGRAVALARIVRKERPALSVCHGSRGCLLASRLLGIPNLTLTDYEHAARIPSIRPNWLMVPSVIPAASFKFDSSRLMTYPGIKEDVYLPQFRPDPELRRRLGISSESLMILVRPPASEAHYHNPESESLLAAVLDLLTRRPAINVVLLPRNKRQETDLRSAHKENISAGRIAIPSQVEDGLNLIWNSDLVISGGGTMNREAAAMGVPVYSIFRGTIGAVDRYLAEKDRLVLIQTIEDVRTRIRIEPRQRELVSSRALPAALETIVQSIISLADGDKSSVSYAA